MSKPGAECYIVKLDTRITIAFLTLVLLAPGCVTERHLISEWEAVAIAKKECVRRGKVNTELMKVAMLKGKWWVAYSELSPAGGYIVGGHCVMEISEYGRILEYFPGE